MFAVSSTGWSPTLATLLLVMSTTLQPFLLPTVQASVVSGTVRQMWRPSMDSNSGLTKHRSTLATGRLGRSFSPDAQLCLDSIDEQGSDANVMFVICTVNQEPWLALIKETVSGGEKSNEYKCKALYCLDYCRILVGNSFCTANQSAALLKDVQIGDIDGNTQACKSSASWIPPLESLPKMTSEFTTCFQTVKGKDDVDECLNKIPTKNVTSVDELTELQCKSSFGQVNCTIDAACKYCPSSASKILSFEDQFWTPAKVECTKWSSDKPKFECPANIPTGGPETACESKLGGKDAECKAEALRKYPHFEDSQEKRCKYGYYVADCAVKAGCKYCTDSETKEPFDLLRKTLDALREMCKEWSSDEPKVECPSNTLMIVGIIIGVIALLVVIGVAVYCLCLAPDNSAAGPSSNAGAAGGGGSRASSKINSGKAGSTMGSKQQQSRASTGAKQQSRIGAKQSNRA